MFIIEDGYLLSFDHGRVYCATYKGLQNVLQLSYPHVLTLLKMEEINLRFRTDLYHIEVYEGGELQKMIKNKSAKRIPYKIPKGEVSK